MHLSKKRRWLVLVLMLLVAASTFWLWNLAHRPPPQIITLPDGTQYRFAGVTYGTNNTPPALLARLVRHLPQGPANFMRRVFSEKLSQSLNTSANREPQLFVWFQRLGPNPHSASPLVTLDALLADDNDFEAGEKVRASFLSGVTWSFTTFKVLPRRGRTIRLSLYQASTIVSQAFSLSQRAGAPSTPSSNSAPTLIGSVTFPNPLPGPFPQLKPQPLPASKQDGDLEVRLLGLSAGHFEPGIVEQRPPKRGENRETKVHLSFHDANLSADAWSPVDLQLSDATGNRLHSRSLPMNALYRHSTLRSGSLEDDETLPGALWPDEAAWRLKLTMKRNWGFTSQELVTFKNLPMPAYGATNRTPVTNVVGGIQVVFTEMRREATVPLANTKTGPPPCELYFKLPGRPVGLIMEPTEVTADHGPPDRIGFEGTDYYYVLHVYHAPTNSTTMDVTFSLQKPRTVEFLVPPPGNQSEKRAP